MPFATAYKDQKKVKIMFDPKEGRTEQNHKNEVDVNRIIEKYKKTGVLQHRNENRGEYGIASEQSFMDAQYIVATAQSMFEEVPSHIRAKFDNNPAKFLGYVQDPKNAEEMVKLGLATSVDDIPSKTQQKETYKVIKTAGEAGGEASAAEGGTPAGQATSPEGGA